MVWCSCVSLDNPTYIPCQGVHNFVTAIQWHSQAFLRWNLTDQFRIQCNPAERAPRYAVFTFVLSVLLQWVTQLHAFKSVSVTQWLIILSHLLVWFRHFFIVFLFPGIEADVYWHWKKYTMFRVFVLHQWLTSCSKLKWSAVEFAWDLVSADWESVIQCET